MILIRLQIMLTELYLKVKYALPNAISKIPGMQYLGEQDENADSIRQTNCPDCRQIHDIDYPKCPFCGYSTNGDSDPKCKYTVKTKICPECETTHDREHHTCPFCGHFYQNTESVEKTSP